jgi:hypothetical protein
MDEDSTSSVSVEQGESEASSGAICPSSGEGRSSSGVLLFFLVMCACDVRSHQASCIYNHIPIKGKSLLCAATDTFGALFCFALFLALALELSLS